MQSEIPKPETVPEDYEFNFSTFISDNWFYLVSVVVVIAIVIYYTQYRKR